MSSLIERSPIVIECSAQTSAIGCREKAAPAIAAEFKSSVCEQFCSCLQADGSDLIAPRTDCTDAPSRAGLYDLNERPLLANRCGVDRQPANVLREVAHEGNSFSAGQWMP
jgi:hypothetical protein